MDQAPQERPSADRRRRQEGCCRFGRGSPRVVLLCLLRYGGRAVLLHHTPWQRPVRLAIRIAGVHLTAPLGATRRRHHHLAYLTQNTKYGRRRQVISGQPRPRNNHRKQGRILSQFEPQLADSVSHHTTWSRPSAPLPSGMRRQQWGRGAAPRRPGRKREQDAGRASPHCAPAGVLQARAGRGLRAARHNSGHTEGTNTARDGRGASGHPCRDGVVVYGGVAYARHLTARHLTPQDGSHSKFGRAAAARR